MKKFWLLEPDLLFGLTWTFTFTVRVFSRRFYPKWLTLSTFVRSDHPTAHGCKSDGSPWILILIPHSPLGIYFTVTGRWWRPAAAVSGWNRWEMNVLLAAFKLLRALLFLPFIPCVFCGATSMPRGWKDVVNVNRPLCLWGVWMHIRVVWTSILTSMSRDSFCIFWIPKSLQRNAQNPSVMYLGSLYLRYKNTIIPTPPRFMCASFLLDWGHSLSSEPG